MEQLTGQVSQLTAALGTQEQLAKSYAQLKQAHKAQGEQMQRLQEEARKVDKYRQTAKQQDAIIQRLEGLLAAALKDSKRLKMLEPEHAALKKQQAATVRELDEAKAEIVRINDEAKAREKQLKEAIESGQLDAPVVKGEGDEEDGDAQLGNAFASEDQVKLRMRAEKAERAEVAAACEERRRSAASCAQAVCFSCVAR